MDVVVYDKVDKESDRLANLLLGTYPQETITDVPIASFDDGADNVPIKSLTVAIEPQQDFHGYDHPWPAGGNINLLDYANASVGSTTVKFNEINLTANQQYCFTYYGAVNVSIIIYDHSSGDRISTSSYTKVYTYMPTADVVIDASFYNSDGITAAENMFQLEKGSTSSPWSPYSNICPITGFTKANVMRTGKNLFDPAVYSTYYQNDGIYRGYIDNVGKIIIRVPSSLLNTVCTFSAYLDLTNSGTLMNAYAEAIVANEKIIGTKVVKGTVGRSVVTFTPTSNRDCIHITFGSNGHNECTFYGVQLELGSTATDYEPYISNQIPIAFPTEAGPVYGGTLTINSDGSVDLVVKTMKYTITGTETNYRFDIQQTSMSNSVLRVITSKGGIKNNANQRCNYASYNENAWEASTLRANTFVIGTEGNAYLQLSTSVAMTVDNYKTLFAANPLEIVAELATPITYQLTPQQLTTLLGTNNIWADTGNIKSLTYRADLGKYIDNAITTAVANSLNA